MTRTVRPARRWLSALSKTVLGRDTHLVRSNDNHDGRW
jgi:hypothetical protein